MQLTRDSARTKNLEKALMKGETVSDDHQENMGEEYLCELAKNTLLDVQKEFDNFFAERQNNMNEVVQRAEEQIIHDQALTLEAALEEVQIPSGKRKSLCNALGIP